MEKQLKNILGLDLGTNSIGFAHVIEGDTPEKSEIVQIGSRIISLTVDEQTNFEKGKSFSINNERTLKRGARRNLDRYKIRRKNLIETLVKANIINNESVLNENGENTTFSTWMLRSKAATERIEKDEFARVLIAINKKRGYKSSRKAKNEDDGVAIDGMEIAKKLYDENLTPGQLTYDFLQKGKTSIPDFYRSDLQAEFDKVWNFQKQFYPEILTDEFYKAIEGKGLKATSALFWTTYQFNTAENKGKKDEKKLQAYKWRSETISKQLAKEEVAYVIAEINNNLNNSSGYLGAISDRSKELYFNNQTVGQYLYQQLQKNRHASLKNQVFYRQDYLDEFEKIWETQAKFHTELTPELKVEIRDIIIFYQRKLKSQKGLISFCELESKEIDDNGAKKTIGYRVAPKSSLNFQEFKIWQILHNVLIRRKGSKKRTIDGDNIFALSSEDKQLIFNELNLKGNLTASMVLDLLGLKSSEYELNYTALEGNNTYKSLYEAFLKILDIEGYNVKELLRVKSNKDEVELKDIDVAASEIKKMVKQIFETLGINSSILDFNAELDKKDFENQPSFQLWHLLYSYEGDDSQSGNEKLYELLESKFGFKKEHGKILANISFSNEYSSLSTKAMRTIFPFIKESKYSTACELAGYRHSKHSLTKEELENRILEPTLKLLKKNSLRQPVVEKILNQLVNVVNTLIEKNSKKDANGNIIEYFKFDEIRIELARELKKNAKERAEMTSNINSAKLLHEKYYKILQNDFGIINPTRNDIIKYKLYLELKENGFRTLYSNTYIERSDLFSKKFDIEHIIPKSRLFDDSFSNKTLELSDVNKEKGAQTAFDFVESKYGSTNEYESRLKSLFELNQKNKEEGISKAKYKKLLMRESEIGDGFIERDLRETQYIAKKAKEMLFQITNSVVSTSGSITERLREDWDLINIMKELNLPKYRSLDLTEMEERKYGQKVEVIKDWTKRNDHRHHAMDALTVAFTKRSYIQYLNNLNARRNDENSEGISNSDAKQSIETSILKISTRDVIAIEKKELHRDEEGKLRFNLPIPNFRQVAKAHLESILISHKAKNKVVTKNKNRIKTKNGEKIKIELTPRGQLHKETVYGKYQFYETKEDKISAKFDVETVNKVANPLFRKLLLQRLSENENDPKKAFSGKNALNKTPIYLDDKKTIELPESVKLVWLTEDYSIRKDITPDNFKDDKSIKKIVDKGIKTIMENRLKEYGGDYKKAFSDLDKNPIWLNKEKGISIKRVTISGVSNAEPLHYKKDHFGNFILDKNGKKIPTDFVSTGNNHHVAIYKDENGNLQEYVVSFYEAVSRSNQGLPIIDKAYNEHLGWQFQFTMKQNEMFVFPNEKTGFDPNTIDLLDPKNKKIISENLFRVQTLSVVKYGNNTIRDFKFRHHLESVLIDNKELQGITYQQIKSLSPLMNIVKVQINHLGDIVKVGEY